MVTLGNSERIYSTFSINKLKSKPLRIYSAWDSYDSQEVKIINSFTLPSSIIFLTNPTNFSTKFLGIPKLVLIDRFKFLFGLSVVAMNYKSFQVSLDNNGSPPVTLNVCKSLYNSGHQFQNDST